MNETNFFRGLIVLLLIVVMNTGSFAEDEVELTMYVGEVMSLDSYVITDHLLNLEEDMIWSSGNTLVAEVSDLGVVTAKTEGTATMFARDEKGLSEVAIIKISVVTMVESFRLNDETVNIKIGETYKLPYTITAVDGQPVVYEDAIEWISANRQVVTVDKKGQLLGIREGTTTVYAVTVDEGKKDQVTVNVSGLINDIIVDGDKESIQVFVGGRHNFTATSDGRDVSSGVIWTTSQSDILGVGVNGEAIGKKVGQSQVKAATKDLKKFDTIMVDVVSMVESIKISQSKVTLTEVGETVDLNYSLIPKVPGISPLESGAKWTTSNFRIATVDQNGVVSAKSDGVALIKVVSLDGEYEDYCSVTVKIGPEKVSFVEEITLLSPREILSVGEKYALPIVFDPVDATENELTFKLSQGSLAQIKKDEETYYFTPSNEGDYKIVMKAESGADCEYEVEVISPIKGVEFPTKGLTESSGEYLFYVGQKMLLEPVFKKPSKYAEIEVFETDATWMTDNSDVAKIVKEIGQNDQPVYYLLGTGTGTTKVHVKSKDGGYKDDTDIKVLSSYAALELNDDVTLPINMEMKPDVKVTMRSNLKYELIPGDNFELDMEVAIKHHYVRTPVIQEEIELEKGIILDLQKSAVGSDSSAIIYGEIKEHKKRLEQLEQVLSTSRNGYCEIKDYIELKDVFGKDYVVATVDENKETVTGVRDGKIELDVYFPGTRVHAVGTYYFSSDLKDIVIVNDSGKIIGFNESGFNAELARGNLEEQLAFALRINERFGNRSEAHKPSSAYIKAILDLEDLNFLPTSLKSKYRSSVTRLEMAETFVGLIEYIGDKKLKRPNSSRFKDTASVVADLSYELGIMDIPLAKTFDPIGQVTPMTFAKAIDKSIVAMEALGYDVDKLMLYNDLSTGPIVFTDIENVSPSYRVYIEKYATIYTIIEGKEDKLHPTAGLTKEEFLYYVWKLLY